MADFKVKLKALAYEKSHPKTKLSEYENDSDYVTYGELLSELTALREWVLANVSTATAAKLGGDLDSKDIIDYENLYVDTVVNCGDITEKYTSKLTYYYFCGDVASLSE